MLEAILKRFKQDRHGVSNVIVVMLSLVLIVVIVSNVVLWSYQMNQFDWEKMQENIAVVDVISIDENWLYNPYGYTVGGSTSLVSGSISDLTADDGVYMTFRGYYSGMDTSDFVDNDASNVDSSVNKGTHSNFTAQQFGPDSIYDTLTEQNTAAGWWNSDWSYRKSHVIQSASGAGTNYQVKIVVVNGTGSDSGDTIYINDKTRSDFGDVRFIDIDNSTELDYWMEECNSGESATFWVEVQDDLSSSDATIWVYYGNSAATTTSNGTATFIFFDDFSGDLGKWHIHKDGDVFIDNTFGYSAPSLKIVGGKTSGDYGFACIGSNVTYEDFLNGVIEADIYPASNGLPEIVFRGNYSANTGYKGRWDCRSESEPPWNKPPYSGWSSFGPSVPRFGIANQWQKVKLVVSGNTFRIYSNDQLKSTCTNSEYTNAGEIALANHYGSYSYFDNIRVRKHIDPEPGHGNWGSEEQYEGGSWEDYSSELLVNSGAEFGNTTGWTATGPNAANFAAGFDCPAGSAGPHTGSYAFYWNNSSSSSDWAYQEVDLSPWLLEIQAGEAQIAAKGWLVCSEYHVPPWDIVRMKVVFYDNLDQEISSDTYDTGERGDLQEWTEFGIENYTIPTNAVKVTIWFQTFENNYDAGNADDFTIKIRTYNSDTNYELDLEVQWTNADYTCSSEELCIKTGNTGAEDIKMYVWNNSSWHLVFSDLAANSWNNVSVSAYLGSPTFTIRFQDGDETGDLAQDSWDIDVTLLHIWSDEYTLEVEFTGSSNTEYWTQLNWTVNSAWTIGSVNVTLQLYNYTLDGYPTSGSGYVAYTSSDSPNTDEDRSQTIDINPIHFRNTTGYWKMKIKGVKATDTQFDLKADLIEIKALKRETVFTFKNEGSLTSHLVSLWIIDSTVHKRFDISVFVNSGETLPYSRVDIDLSTEQYVVRVVTERGNTAIYSNT